MALTRWEPLSEFMPLRDMMSRLMEESFIMPRFQGTFREAMTTFPVDIWENENDVCMSAALPGCRPEDVDVRVTDNVLTIRAEHKEEQWWGEQQQAPMQRQQGQGGGAMHGQVMSGQRMPGGETEGGPTWHRREISRGTFFREITLPMEVEPDKASARFENGMLQVCLPKAEMAKTKRIQVQGGTTQQGQPRIQGR